MTASSTPGPARRDLLVEGVVASVQPHHATGAAVRRQTTDGANPNGWHPEQRVTVEAAPTAYTRTAAHAGFRQDRRGRPATGHLADVVVLDRDPSAMPPDRIGGAGVPRTFVDWQERYAAAGA